VAQDGCLDQCPTVANLSRSPRLADRCCYQSGQAGDRGPTRSLPGSPGSLSRVSVSQQTGGVSSQRSAAARPAPTRPMRGVYSGRMVCSRISKTDDAHAGFLPTAWIDLPVEPKTPTAPRPTARVGSVPAIAGSHDAHRRGQRRERNGCRRRRPSRRPEHSSSAASEGPGCRR